MDQNLRSLKIKNTSLRNNHKKMNLEATKEEER
jgi:hypothetical protein